MFVLSLLLFAAVLLVLAGAASRGLADVDQILTIVEPDTPTAATAGPQVRAEG